jgi:hypothetical protein
MSSLTSTEKATVVSIKHLLTQGEWAKVRKRLERIKSPKRIGEILYHSAAMPAVPDDLFETMLFKLKTKRKPTKAVVVEGVWDLKEHFWKDLCNYHGLVNFDEDFWVL